MESEPLLNKTEALFFCTLNYYVQKRLQSRPEMQGVWRLLDEQNRDWEKIVYN